ncbi:MAG: beta strand repeat-containing protein, partial [Planctomycetota bacterium]
ALADNLVFNSDLTLDGGSRLRLLSGATVAGANINLTGIGTQVIGVGYTTTLSGKTINLDGSSSTFSVDGDNTVTLDTGTTLRGAGGINVVFSNAGSQHLVNKGLISSDTETLSVNNFVESLTNDPGGNVQVVGGNILNMQANQFINNGDMLATGGSVLRLSSTGGWDNNGTITVDATSRLEIEVPFATADLGTIDNSAGGTVRVETTWDNSGETFNFNTTTGSWFLFGGTVSGGTLNPGPGGDTLLFSSSQANTLTNNATVVGDLNLIGSSRVRLFSGATFTGQNVNYTGSGTKVLGVQYDFTLVNQHINMTEGTPSISIDADTTLTVGPNSSINGKGGINVSYSSAGSQQLVNQGLITANLGSNFTVSTSIDNLVNESTGTLSADNSLLNIGANRFENNGIAKAENGGILRFNTGIVDFTNVAADTLTGGTWQVLAGSRIELEETSFTINAADITLSGAGSVFLLTTDDTPIEDLLTTNTADGALRILDSRNYTTSNSLDNSGVIQLGGGSLSPASLTNSAGGEIFGHGAVIPIIANSGTVRAAGGILTTAHIDGQSGSIVIDPDGTFNLSIANADSDADYLTHNGTDPESLRLGVNDIIVGVDYNNANFGVGDAFDHRANVTGTGLIRPAVATAQSVTGADISDGATATPTLDFGNVRVGTQNASNFNLNHVDGGSGSVLLRLALKTVADGGNVTDARLNGSGVTAGNLGPIARGASHALTVNFDPDTSGPLTGQAVFLDNNFDNVDTQTLVITGEAYNPADPAVTPDPVALGAAHVGDTLQQVMTVANNAPAGDASEDLDVTSIAASGHASLVAGSPTEIQNLLAGASNTDVSIEVDTSTPGVKAGSFTADLTSTGEVNSVDIPGLDPLPLTPANISVSATVYGFAQPLFSDVMLGEFHTGAPVNGSVQIDNTAATDGFHEDLNATVSGFGGDVTSAAGSVDVAAGGSAPTGIDFSVAISTPGAKSGTIDLDLTSLAQVAGSPIVGLSDTPLAPGQVDVTASAFALAETNDQPDTIDFGVVHIGDAVSQALTVTNTATPSGGFTEFLDAARTSTLNHATSAGPIGNLAAGDSSTAISVGIETDQPRTINGSVTIGYASDPNGINALGTTSLGSQTIDILGQVNHFASVEYLFTSGDGMLSLTGPNEFTLDFGSVPLLSGPPSAQLALLNGAPATHSDTLSGSFTLPNLSPFTPNGFGNFAGLAGLDSIPVSVSLADTFPGIYQDAITLDPSSDNASSSTPLPTLTLNLVGEIAAIPGDFNFDALVNDTDVDLLSDEINAGAHGGLFDLTDDALVDAQDGVAWIGIYNTFPGDFNLDRVVGVPDLILWAQNFGLSPNARFTLGDSDFSGTIGVPDLIEWAQNFGNASAPPTLLPPAVSSSSGATAIPEPGSAALALALVTLLKIRRRHSTHRPHDTDASH